MSAIKWESLSDMSKSSGKNDLCVVAWISGNSLNIQATNIGEVRAGTFDGPEYKNVIGRLMVDCPLSVLLMLGADNFDELDKMWPEDEPKAIMVAS